MDNISGFGTTLSKIRKERGLSQQELAERVNELVGTEFKRTTVSNWESGTSTPKLDIILALVKSLDVSPNMLLGYQEKTYEEIAEERKDKIKKYQESKSKGETADKLFEPLPEAKENFEDPKDVYPNVYPNVYLSEKDKTKRTQIEVAIRPVMVTVDHMLNEVITFVPVKAQAGYLVGYADPEFIKELPAFAFPRFNHGTFRAFEVEGYSMLQYEGAGLYPSDIVTGLFVEDPVKEVRDNRVYIVASDEGLLIKRCVNRLDSNGKLICNSDNKNGDYPPIVLDKHQIKEVWEFKGKFSHQLPKATRVYEEITEVQTKQALMEEEMKRVTDQLKKLSALLEKPKDK